MAIGLSERMGLQVHPKQSRELPTYLVSLLPICCRSSSRSSSVCRGRMFFSSSSRLEGLLLSLMAKESFLHTFMAREPAGGERGVNKVTANLGPRLLQGQLWTTGRKTGRRCNSPTPESGQDLSQRRKMTVCHFHSFCHQHVLSASQCAGHMRSTRATWDWISAPQELPTWWEHHKGGQDRLWSMKQNAKDGGGGAGTCR